MDYVKIGYRDYIASLESNDIIMGFDAFNIENIDRYPLYFSVVDKDERVYGKFHIAKVIRDKNYDIEKLIYKGYFEDRGEWTATVYNVEYSSLQDEEENKMMEF